MTSSAAALARAMADARAGRIPTAGIRAIHGPAQAGALLRLVENCPFPLPEDVTSTVDGWTPAVRAAFSAGAPGQRLLGAAYDASELERAAADWFVPHPTPGNAAAGGYWLAHAFLRGVGSREATLLANFLIGGTVVPSVRDRPPAVRRYPTGGISEKQALILPPLVRAMSTEMGWCSPFMVAKRLAHTGGTLDKLGSLPGFRAASRAMLARWTGRSMPVSYVAAGDDICPRDAAMYRMRGETGTVADHGLMAASILSKQAAVPVDGLVLDILHGPTAFLASEREATDFGNLCQDVGSRLGLAIRPAYRAAPSPVGRSIGTSTEVLEALELLRPSGARSGDPEIEQAIRFTGMLADTVGRDADLASSLAERALHSGDALRHMYALWEDHGVDSRFLAELAAAPRATILGRLDSFQVRAQASGILRYDWLALADMVNNLVNGFRPTGHGPTVLRPGGVELLVEHGAWVRRGEPIMTAYVDDGGAEAAGALGETFSVDPAGAGADEWLPLPGP